MVEFKVAKRGNNMQKCLYLSYASKMYGKEQSNCDFQMSAVLVCNTRNRSCLMVCSSDLLKVLLLSCVADNKHPFSAKFTISHLQPFIGCFYSIVLKLELQLKLLYK